MHALPVQPHDSRWHRLVRPPVRGDHRDHGVLLHVLLLLPVPEDAAAGPDPLRRSAHPHVQLPSGAHVRRVRKTAGTDGVSSLWLSDGPSVSRDASAVPHDAAGALSWTTHGACVQPGSSSVLSTSVSGSLMSQSGHKGSGKNKRLFQQEHTHSQTHATLLYTGKITGCTLSFFVPRSSLMFP